MSNLIKVYLSVVLNWYHTGAIGKAVNSLDNICVDNTIPYVIKIHRAVSDV